MTIPLPAGFLAVGQGLGIECCLHKPMRIRIIMLIYSNQIHILCVCVFVSYSPSPHRANPSTYVSDLYGLSVQYVVYRHAGMRQY